MRGYLNRPKLKKIFQYRSYVEKNIFDLLTKLSLTPKKKIFFIIGINHEQQHQELILMDILNIFFKKSIKTSIYKKKKD